MGCEIACGRSVHDSLLCFVFCFVSSCCSAVVFVADASSTTGAIQIGTLRNPNSKGAIKTATPPRSRHHLSTICSSHSPAHHPKCKSCASETLAPLHLINATSCSIKQRNANPQSSSFQTNIDNKLLWQCLGTTLLPKVLTLHICFVHSPPSLPGINGQRPANTQALASSNFQFSRRVQN